MAMGSLGGIIESTKAWACYDCGKCTATCPIPRAGGKYSPRRQVMAANLGRRKEIIEDETLFTCLTCGACEERCPSEVGFVDFVRQLREMGANEGMKAECPHGGALHSAMRMMAAGKLKQKRLGWLTEGLNVRKKKGEVFFFTGCTMYFDAFFSDFGVNTLDGTKAAVKLLNHLGVKPVVSGNERCCGHDLLWNGDRAAFEKLARYNVKLLEGSGAKTLITSCAECLRTWKVDYAPFFSGNAPEMLHLTEYLAAHVEDLNLASGEGVGVKTFQDPCRLGRHLGVYDAPRQVLEVAAGEFVEMPKSRKGAVCCAGGPWSSCDRFAKKIQVDRLKEARATGAEALVTACPKCQVHFKCAMQDPNLKDEIEIEVLDIAEVLSCQLS